MKSHIARRWCSWRMLAVGAAWLTAAGCEATPEREPPSSPTTVDAAVKRDTRTTTAPVELPDAAPIVTAGKDGAPAVDPLAPDASSVDQRASADGPTLTGDASAAPDGGGTPGGLPMAGTPSTCAGAGLEVCVSFDDALPSGWSLGGAQIETDPGKVFRGSKSLRIAAGGGTVNTGGPNVWNGNRMWGRAFVFFSAAPAGGHSQLVVAQGDKGAYRIGMKSNPTGFMSTYRYSGESVAECTKKCAPQDLGKTAIPVGKWACLEWEFDGTGGKSTRLFMNGTELSLPAYNPELWAANTFTGFSIGYRYSSGTPGNFTIWVDELALSKQRITCER